MNKMIILSILAFTFNCLIAQNEEASAGQKIIVPDVMPQFVGGSEALLEYLTVNAEFPKNKEVLEENDKVLVGFKVNEDGKITEVRLLKGIDKKYDKEAVRLIKEMSNWTVGEHNGEPVTVECRIAINFKQLEDQETGQLPFRIEGRVVKTMKSMPQFIGGQEILFKYLGANIKYPQDAVKKGISGTVVVSFVVSKTGEITNVEIKKSLFRSCDAEALRVVGGMPNWQPALDKNGEPMSCRYYLPIKFKLPISFKDTKKNT